MSERDALFGMIVVVSAVAGVFMHLAMREHRRVLQAAGMLKEGLEIVRSLSAERKRLYSLLVWQDIGTGLWYNQWRQEKFATREACIDGLLAATGEKTECSRT